MRFISDITCLQTLTYRHIRWGQKKLQNQLAL